MKYELAAIACIQLVNLTEYHTKTFFTCRLYYVIKCMYIKCFLHIIRMACYKYYNSLLISRLYPLCTTYSIVIAKFYIKKIHIIWYVFITKFFFHILRTVIYICFCFYSKLIRCLIKKPDKHICLYTIIFAQCYPHTILLLINAAYASTLISTDRQTRT